MKATKINPGIYFALIIFSVLLTACNKKPDQVGLGLQPSSEELSVILDVDQGLLSHSLREDSVRTDVNAVQTASLGSMLDPAFGLTDAEIFSQFRLSENGHSFRTDDHEPVFDSLVLSLRYSGVYGDSLSTQRIIVYELSEDMKPDTTYYSNQTIEYIDDVLADTTFIPALSDSVTDGELVQPAQLRIKLSQEFAEKILAEENGSALDDNESWLEFMKGLRITAETTTDDGGIMLFDMFSVHTNLTMYYRLGDPEDTLSFSFLSNDNCARFTGFDHNDYLEASQGLRAQIIDGDTSQGAQQIYLQAMGGVKAQLRLPDIQEYFGPDPIAINEAKLIFNVYDDGSELTPAPQLAIAKIDEDGNYVLLPDAAEPAAYYSGYLNPSETQYYFRISRYVQQVLTGESPNYPLILLISGSSFRANRVILHGPDEAFNAEKRMMLQVTYTKVN